MGNPLGKMIKVRVLSSIKIWRFRFYWCKGYFSVWWLKDWSFCKNLIPQWRYSTEKPLLQLGDKW